MQIQLTKMDGQIGPQQLIIHLDQLIELNEGSSVTNRTRQTAIDIGVI